MATTYELDDILNPKVITESYREMAGQYDENPLTKFYSTQMKSIPGDQFEFAYRFAQKTPAPANFRGEPARVLQPTGLARTKIWMLRAFNQINLSMDALQMVRKRDDETLQEKGREEIDQQMEDFGDRHKVFRNVCLAKTLADGEVSIDPSGKVMESSSGAQYTVDFGVPASHKSQLDPGSGNIIGTAWDQAGAKILDDLDDIRNQAEIENAETPQHIWLHTTAKRWLRDNTQLQNYIQAGGSPEKLIAFSPAR